MRLKPFIPVCLLALSVFLTSQIATAADNTVVQILVGEQKSVDVTNVKRVAIADPEIADVKVLADTNEMLITGIASGTTSLSIWDNSGEKQTMTIKVLSRDPKEIKKEVEELLKDVEGITVHIVGDRVFIDGEVFREKDLERAKTVAKLYPQVTLLADYNKAYLQMVRMIVVDFNLYQITKTDLLGMGLNWNEALNLAQAELSYRWLMGLGDPLSSTQAVSGTVINIGGTVGAPSGPSKNAKGGDVFLTSKFNPVEFNQEDGRIRFLENHQVTVKSGEEAQYQFGGEFPYTVILPQGGSTVIEIQFKPYGSIFKVTPEIDKINNLNVAIDAEVSKLDFSVAQSNVPGLQTVRTKTKVNMKSDQTLILGGFLSLKHEKITAGMPGLMKIPVLGYLFGSKSFRDSKSEGVVFITPSLITPSDDPREFPRVKGVLDSFEQDDFKL